MAPHLTLKNPVAERGLHEWGSVAAELAGTETRIVEGKTWKHRVITAGTSGPPLLMYHGVGGHAETYARNIHALAQHFRVHAVDAVFHGYSGKEHFDREHMHDRLAEGVIDLIDALGYRTVLYEGESMGAQIGVNLAMHHPERFDKMVLNAGFYLNKPDREGFTPNGNGAADLAALSQKAVLEPTADNIRRRLHWLVSKPERMTEDMVSIRQRIYQTPEINESLKKVFNIGGAFTGVTHHLGYTMQDLANWKPATLVLWGEHNPGHGPDFGEYWADVIGAQFYEMKNVGHWPQWEAPDEYNAVLAQFFSDEALKTVRN